MKPFTYPFPVIHRFLNLHFRQSRELNYHLKWSLYWGFATFTIAYFMRPSHIFIWPIKEETFLESCLIFTLILVCLHFTYSYFIIRLSYVLFEGENQWKVYHMLIVYAIFYVYLSISLLLIYHYGFGVDLNILGESSIFFYFQISLYIIVGIVFYTVMEYIIHPKFIEEDLIQPLSDPDLDSVSQKIIIPPLQEIIFISEDNRLLLKLMPEQLLIIEAEGNYVMVYWKEYTDKIEKTLLRMPIGKVESILAPQNTFFRCHRSYIINISLIRKLSGKNIVGNARGLTVKLAPLDMEIPVARNRIEEFKKQITELQTIATTS